MLDDFAGNSFVLKILQRNCACKFLKTDWLLTEYGWVYTMCQLCRHIKTDGYKCQSPAMRGSAFCYFHSPEQTMAKVKSSNSEEIKLPLLEDSASIQAAISKAVYEVIDDEEPYYGEVPELKGVWATGKTPEECHENLKMAIEDWIAFSLRFNLPIPMIEGQTIKAPEIC